MRFASRGEKFLSINCGYVFIVGKLCRDLPSEVISCCPHHLIAKTMGEVLEGKHWLLLQDKYVQRARKAAAHRMIPAEQVQNEDLPA
jgi:hypothetical protein